jgi:exodeoxyribonuclease VII small subunit|tara:strand:- start:16 stop:258 length:243 start_codon:yes stop_codon:yes gene_type:complete
MTEINIEKASTLEERLARLTEIVRHLEGDAVDLELALELFEEGIKHVREAEAILNHAEFRVKELIGSSDNLEVHQLKDES